jgi:hypothetical protein
MAPNVISKIGKLLRLTSGIVLKTLVLAKGRGRKPANNLNGSEKWMSMPSETLLRTLSLGEGEEESLEIALMILKNGRVCLPKSC